MGRPNKSGCDYFPLDCDIDSDDRIALIEAKHSCEGFTVAIKLLCKIYKEGYFYHWGEREQILMAKRCGVSVSTVQAIVNDLIDLSFFSADKFANFGILTSTGIQKRFRAIKRSAAVIDPRFDLLLVSTGLLQQKPDINAELLQQKPRDNGVVAAETPQEPTVTGGYCCENTPKRGESKVKESKEKESKGNPPETETPALTLEDEFREKIKAQLSEVTPDIERNVQFMNCGRRPMKKYPDIWFTESELFDVCVQFLDANVEKSNFYQIFKRIQNKITDHKAKGLPAKTLEIHRITTWSLNDYLAGKKAKLDCERAKVYAEKATA